MKVLYAYFDDVWHEWSDPALTKCGIEVPPDPGWQRTEPEGPRCPDCFPEAKPKKGKAK